MRAYAARRYVDVGKRFVITRAERPASGTVYRIHERVEKMLKKAQRNEEDKDR